MLGRQTQSTEPLVSEPGAFQDQTATESLKYSHQALTKLKQQEFNYKVEQIVLIHKHINFT